MSYIIPIGNGSFASAKNGWFCVSNAVTCESLGYYSWMMVGYRLPRYLTTNTHPMSVSPQKRCTVSVEVSATGTIRSRQFSKASASNPTPRIHVGSQPSICDPNNPAADTPATPLPLDSTPMTLFISLKTPRLNDGSNSSSLALSQSTFWRPLIGSWALISNGHVTMTKYWFTSVKPALRLTSLMTTTSIRGISLLMPLPITRGSPSMRALNLMKPMTAQHFLNARRDTKVWSIRLVGWLKAQGLILPHPTPSCHRTITNHLKATGMLHSTSYTIFTQQSTMDLPSRLRHKFLSTHSCCSLHHLTPKHTPTSSRPPLLCIVSPHSNACWGSQFGNAIREGIQLPLFKFWSMSGAIVM